MARLLVELGHDVDEFTLPIDWPVTTSVFGTLSGTHVAATITERARGGWGREPTGDDLERVDLGPAGQRASSCAAHSTTSMPYASMHRIGHEIASAFEEIDVLLTPTVGRPPPPIGLLDMSSNDLASFGREAGRVSNFLGIMKHHRPACDVGTTALDSRRSADRRAFRSARGGEPLLFSLAAQLEKAAPWADRRPKGFS